ncbi:hypothetical protein KZZ52_58175 [Dactylosporangium sp. AC04546]|uniref:hypothetical protein n=1 Tax=Dactylosporangium sp. AC04546 TaxID=2862460 RepID=UPI001EDDD851|nr:hypothetical protein [Dactylosporangium sp. AC04546]WVK83528.1 hypothetical protein KZZ52_58175 [Dactylosporangium sp. AC04546]
MSTDLNALHGVLRARAEGDTDAAALLARIGPAYRRRRTRRVAGTATAVVAVAALVAMLLPRLLLGSYALPAPPAVPIPSPAAGAIGSDPEMIHFDVGQFPYRANAEWAVRDGVERLSMQGSTVDDSNAPAKSFFVELTLAPAAASPPTPDPTGPPMSPEQLHSSPATVGGQSALVETGDRTTRVTWQPIAGVRAELSVRGPVPADKTIAFADTLSLERGHPCAPHVRPTVLPTDARIAGCSIQPATGLGGWLIRGPGGTISVVVAPGVYENGISPGRYPGAAPTLANGWRYEELGVESSTQHYTADIRIPDPYVFIRSQGAYGLADVVLVGGGLDVS